MKNTKKTIAITTARMFADDGKASKIFARAQYPQSITNAGGRSILVPTCEGLDDDYFDWLVKTTDGLLLTGGGDIDPDLYSEEKDEKSGHFNAEVPMSIDRLRDYLELNLLKCFYRAKKPILGICRGCQLINIYFGGTLHQDLSKILGSNEPHFNPKGEQALDEYYHDVKLVKGTIFSRMLKKDCFAVNSFHHQAIDRVGEELTVSARSSDGIIEAVEFLKFDQFILGIQWHPEQHFDEESKIIFSSFLDAC